MTRVALMADDDGSLWGGWTSPASGAREILLIVLVLSLIALAGFIWAAFWRKPRRRRHSYHHSSPADDSSGGLPVRRKERSGVARLFRRKRHRAHRRHERPVNPTLSQIGGLPPPRRDPPPRP